MTDWPSFGETFSEAPATPALPAFSDDHPAWCTMPDDPTDATHGLLEPLPEPREVAQHREAQAKREREAIAEREREGRFVDEYCYDGDAVQAAARAGYPMATTMLADLLMGTPAVARAIRERFDAMTAEDLRVYVERRLMAEARTFGKGKMPVAVIKALVELAKLKGFVATPPKDNAPYVIQACEADMKL